MSTEWKLFLVLVLCSILSWSAGAQDTDNVGQTIVWGGTPYAQRYELVIAAGDVEVARISTTQPHADLHLAPGAYRYRVLVYNLLGVMEVTSDWIEIQVLEAKIPQIVNLSPDTVYLKGPRLQLVVRGDSLETGARYLLTRPDHPEEVVTGSVVADNIVADSNVTDSLTTVRISFASGDLSPGDYTLTVVNPGGLKRTAPKVLHVKDGIKDDFHLTLGYSPGVSFYDSWFLDTWQTFHAWGWQLTALAELVKVRPYHLGAEIEARWWTQEGQWPVGGIQSQFVSMGGNAVFSVLLPQRLRILARIGAGSVVNWHTIRLGNDAEVESWYSVVPYAALGTGLFWQPWANFFLESDLTIQHLFGDGYAGGILRPSLSLGILF